MTEIEKYSLSLLTQELANNVFSYRIATSANDIVESLVVTTYDDNNVSTGEILIMVPNSTQHDPVNELFNTYVVCDRYDHLNEDQTYEEIYNVDDVIDRVDKIRNKFNLQT